MRQQPVAARACGFGERDRRVIDPPPIVQLSLTDFDPTSAADVAALRQQFNVVHCALFSVPHQSSALATGADVTAIPDPNTGRLNRRLMGSLVANAFIAIDPEAPPSNNENARLGSFFIFHDLSCRQNGLYKLHFTLMCLDVTAIPTHAQSNRAASVESNVFEVFSAKDFPGMKSSTLLTRELKRQGANVSVKKGNEGKSGRKPKKRDSVDTDDSASEASEGGAVAAQQSRKKRKE
ncbi:hypothetical protein MMC24_000726 [Lignoscripta atroalba]|nr:hypothetical protein [Lignoscripta atroalba]